MATKITKELREALKAELSPVLFALKQRVAEGNDLLSIIAAAKGLTLVVDGAGKELPMLKGDKGDSIKGDDGHTPILGKDYFTEADKKEMLAAITPKKGVDYEDGVDGKTPKKGKDYFTKAEQIVFLKQVTPVLGKDYFTKTQQAQWVKDIADAIKPKAAPAISGHDIRDKLEALTGSSKLSYKAIKGLEGFVANTVAANLGANGSSIGGGGGNSSVLTTKGDLLGYSTTLARLAIGTDTYVLTADAASPLGFKWAAAAGGAVWGGITGSLAAQTDLATALGAKASIASLAAVAFSGAYADMSGVLDYINASGTVGAGATFGHDSGNGFRFGIYNSNWYGLWNTGITASTSNYALIARKDGTSVQYNSTDNISFNISDVSKLYINAVGNVGVGITNQTYKLDVGGDINIASGSHYKIAGVNLSYADVGADASGAASAALITAEAYTDSAVAAMVTLTGTQVLTNKRITQRVTTIADATSITPNFDSADASTHVNTQTAGTLTVNAPGGTPTDFQKCLLRIKSTNVQTFAFNAAYRFSSDLPAPTGSTGGGKTDYLAFTYNAADSKYDYTGKVFGF